MKKIIPLSNYIGVTRSELEKNEILDIDLGVDTRYFIDPILLNDSKIAEFKQSRTKILDYFSKVVKMVKFSDISTQMKQKTLQMLAVKEPQGLSIGYGGKTDKGTAISKSVAIEMIKTILEILQVGIEDPEIVEILSMFVAGYGPDSISDLTVHIIYEDFCNFTEQKCKELKVKTEIFYINERNFNLPKHPFNTTPIIFIPTTLISPLPVATDWESVQAVAQFNSDLREKVSEILFPALLGDIRSIRTKNPQELREIKEKLKSVIDVYKKIKPLPYDLSIDPSGFYSISPAVEKLSHFFIPSSKPKNQEELVEAVRELLIQFQKSIEHNGLNKLLYKENGKPHREEVSQLLLYNIADVFCCNADILLSRESNAGGGPVDFSLGTGYRSKIIIEIKKSNNPNIISGYNKQVEEYKKGESAFYAFYLVILVAERKSDDQLTVLEKLYEDAQKTGEKVPELFIIDGLKHPSPSKLR